MRTLALLMILSFGTLAKSQGSYWQQQMDYEIHVTLDDQRHVLRGNVEMAYQNNAPQPLDSIYFHFWPNAFSSQQTAFAQQMLDFGNFKFYDAPSADYGRIDSLDFKASNGGQHWLLTDQPDIALLVLDEPIEPGKTVNISTPFRVKIPASFSRLGHTGQAYQITQWYPKPAVYDKNGHHPMPYLNIGEFYSEFGNFEVYITLPENYVVGATGTLQSRKEQGWLKKKEKQSRDRLQYADSLQKAFVQNEFPPSADRMKTLHYTAHNVHDFAWFADKRFNVLLDTVTIPNGEKVQTQALFTDLEASYWKHATAYIDSALTHYSRLVGPYPYPQCTAVEGALSAGAGMEYPMITIIGKMGSGPGLERVITHEVGHNWFYGILGFNERKYPWMDEGINSYYEYRYFREKNAQTKASKSKGDRFLQKAFGITSFSQSTLMDILLQDQQIIGRDQPAGLPATEFSQINYPLDVYHKIARYFEHLEGYLGRERLDHAMQSFYEKWKFKHPGPDDLQQSLEQSTGENLDWLFTGLIQKNETTDHRLKVQKKENGFSVGAKNNGCSSAPYHLSALKNGKIIWEHWTNRADSSFLIPYAKKEIDIIELDPNKITTETNRQNDFYQPNKLFKRAIPAVPHLLGSVEQQKKKMFFIMPVLGWNNYDRSYFGLAFYNNLIPRRGFHFRFFPAFSFQQNDWVGAGTVENNFYFNNQWLRRIRVALTGQTFHEDIVEDLSIRYLKLQPSFSIYWKNLDPGSHLSQQLRVRYIDIFKDQVEWDTKPNPSLTNNNYGVLEFSYKIKNDFKLLPWQARASLEHSDNSARLSAVGNLNFRSTTLGGYVELRLFAGTFLKTSGGQASPREMRFTLSNRPGYLDYKYDELFLGRTEPDGFFYQQQIESDGGFKVRMDHFPFGQNSKWLASTNLSVPIPKVPLVRIFADAGIVPNNGKPELHAESGLTLRLAKDVIEIYFPLLMTNKVKQAFLADTGNYWQRITFQLNISKLNPVKTVREARIDL